MMNGNAREGLVDRFLLVFFRGGRRLGLSLLHEIGEVGGDEGASIVSENILVDRVIGGLEQLGGGIGLK